MFGQCCMKDLKTQSKVKLCHEITLINMKVTHPKTIQIKSNVSNMKMLKLVF